jgi:glycosyltransferase involved in cell wall biosynthesis
MKYDLSIAISSYNRDDKVAKTLRTLFESDLSSIDDVEVVVIDDGSPKPVDAAVKSVHPVPEKFHVRVIRQENSGIGATRNRGYREAQSDRILLLDDDIILPSDAISKLLKAQRETGAAVIFGHYPFITHSSEAVRRFAAELYGYEHLTDEENIEKVDALTSGLLLLDRSKLPDKERFYRDDMTIPAAEEHEVIARFHKTGIPIYAANHISAIHNHHLELKWLVAQQYKYGLATAEAFVKVPEILEMERFAEMRRSLDFMSNNRGKNLAKRLCAFRTGRSLLLIAGRGLEKVSPRGNHNKFYGIVAAAHFWGGYHEGQIRFGKLTVG